jgi:integrase
MKPTITAIPVRPRLPSPETLCDVLLALPSPTRLVGWLMLETGARVEEVLGMKVRSFRRAARQVVVAGEAGERVAAVTGGLAEAMERWLVEVRACFEPRRAGWGEARGGGLPMFPDQWLFPVWAMPGASRRAPDQPITPRVVAEALERAGEALSCPLPLCPQTFRLCCAARWLAQGMDAETMHRRLGHRDLMTTLLMIQALDREGLTYTAPVSRVA